MGLSTSAVSPTPTDLPRFGRRSGARGGARRGTSGCDGVSRQAFAPGTEKEKKTLSSPVFPRLSAPSPLSPLSRSLSPHPLSHPTPFSPTHRHDAKEGGTTNTAAGAARLAAADAGAAFRARVVVLRMHA